MVNKLIKIAVFIFLVISFGYFREIFFVRAKWYELVITNGDLPPEPHWLFGFLKNLSLLQLFYAKIIATLISVLVFWLLTLLMKKLFFRQSPGGGFIHLIFAVIFTVGVLAFLAGKLIGFQAEFFAFSRWVIGLIETPVILMILAPIMYYQERTTFNKS